MSDILLRQDNRITSSRYELSLIEKRVMYFILREIRKQFVLSDTGQRDLFNDLIVKMEGASLVKEVYKDNKKAVVKALKNLRLRSFEYDDEVTDRWFEVGFINYGDWDNGNVEVQISKKVLPFYVELTEKYTEYSLIVAMGLKSKWSQRMYELCAQWRSAGGFQMRVDELRSMFRLEDEYDRYASLKKFVLEAARDELKALYDKGECDLYFNYSERKEGRSVVSWSFKIIVSNNPQNELSSADLDYMIRTELSNLFDTSKHPKNKEFVAKVMASLRLNPDELDRCHKKILYVRQHIPSDEQARYLRFVLKEEFLKDSE